MTTQYDEMIKMDQLLIVLNEGQARFLNQLSRACANYRGSWESIIKRGHAEIDALANNQWINGPSHQVMAEVQQEAGQIKVLLEILWSAFSVADFAEEDKKRGVAEINKFIAIAMDEPKKHGSLGGGTWFMEGRSLADFE